MAEITDPAQSPSVQDDTLAPGNGNGAQENRGIKRQRLSNAGDDDDDDDDKPGRERRKIDIKFIQDKSRRHITFSKRKAGIMKKVSFQEPTVACTSKELGFPGFTLLGESCILDRIETDPSPLGLGIRVVRVDRHPSPSTGRVGNRARLHFHHPQASTVGDQIGRQESHPSMSLLVARELIWLVGRAPA